MKSIASNPNQMPSAVLKEQPDNNHSNFRRAKFFLVAVLGSGWLCAHAHADALTGHYTAIAAGDPDVGGAIYTLPNGMVQNQLGPDGLPVLTSSGIATLGASADMNATTHELLWWSPGLDPHVSADPIPVQVDSMPMNFGYPNPWYVTGQTTDQNFYRSVHWTGTFSLGAAGPVSLNMSSDDDAWLFVDGNLVAETHYDGANPTATFSAGTHSIDIFYADRIPVYDSFALTSSVPLSPVPEPGAITVFAAGAFFLLARASRRQNKVLAS